MSGNAGTTTTVPHPTPPQSPVAFLKKSQKKGKGRSTQKDWMVKPWKVSPCPLLSPSRLLGHRHCLTPIPIPSSLLGTWGPLSPWLPASQPFPRAMEPCYNPWTEPWVGERWAVTRAPSEEQRAIAESCLLTTLPGSLQLPLLGVGTGPQQGWGGWPPWSWRTLAQQGYS